MKDNVAAWTAIVLSGLAILKQSYDFYKSHHKEKIEEDKALDHAPLVRESLALGNVGDAVKVLLAIIESQKKHMDSQDKKIEELEREIEELKRLNRTREGS